MNELEELIEKDYLFSRFVREEDLELCEKLVAQPELVNFQGHYVSKDWLRELCKDGISYIIEQKDKGVIGCIFAEKLKMNGALLWLIAIDPKYKNQGYGTILLKNFEQNCQQIHNIEWIVLYSTTNSSYNKHFYTKNGYENGSGSFYEFGKEL